MAVAQSVQQRSEQIKIATYGREVWSVAQQKVSMFKPHSTLKSLDGGNFKLFTKDLKREYTEKAGGIVPTPYAKHEFSRRAIFSKTYHVAMAADKDDLVDNQVEVLTATRNADEKAAARVCDKVLLSAQLDPVHETSPSTATLRGNGLITAGLDLDKKYRANAWVKNADAANGTAIAKLTGDDLEDIGYIFAQRDINEKLVCTLTPELKRILRKDPDFKNAENVYSSRRAGDSMQAGIEYKDIMFIPCSKEVLPELHAENIAFSDPASANAPVDIAVRGLAEDSGISNHRAGLSSSKITVATTKTATDIEGKALGGKAAVATVRSSDMIYFWVPQALYFVKRDMLNFSRETELQADSFADALYNRINFGAMLIDDDYALTVALKGTIKTKAS